MQRALRSIREARCFFAKYNHPRNVCLRPQGTAIAVYACADEEIYNFNKCKRLSKR